MAYDKSRELMDQVYDKSREFTDHKPQIFIKYLEKKKKLGLKDEYIESKEYKDIWNPGVGFSCEVIEIVVESPKINSQMDTSK